MAVDDVIMMVVDKGLADNWPSILAKNGFNVVVRHEGESSGSASHNCQGIEGYVEQSGMRLLIVSCSGLPESVLASPFSGRTAIIIYLKHRHYESFVTPDDSLVRSVVFALESHGAKRVMKT